MHAQHVDRWQREQESRDPRPTEPPASLGLRRDFGPPGAWAVEVRCPARCRCQLCRLDERLARIHHG